MNSEDLQIKLNELNALAPIYAKEVAKKSLFKAAKSYKLDILKTKNCGMLISLRGDNGITTENAAPVAHSFDEMACTLDRYIANIKTWLSNNNTVVEEKMKECRGELSTNEVREMESNVEEIILTKDSFSGLLGEYESLFHPMPPYTHFDENGEMAMKMQFFDGYAFDTNPHGLGMYDRTALYYPTVDEVSKSADMQDAIEKFTGRRWAEGTKQEQIYDIALKFGQASRLHCPQERFNAAVQAIVERAADPKAKAFTKEQRDKIELAAASNGEKLYHGTSFSQVFYDSLFSHAQQQMQRVPIAWANDAHQELRELNEGKVREEGRGLHR